MTKDIIKQQEKAVKKAEKETEKALKRAAIKKARGDIAVVQNIFFCSFFSNVKLNYKKSAQCAELKQQVKVEKMKQKK